MRQRNQQTHQFIMGDLSGQQFGMLTALEPLEQRDQGRVVWRCRCGCGNIVLRYSSQLRAGVKTNCGCIPVRRIREDLTGRQFGNLTVLGATDQRANGCVVWACRCSCGEMEMVQTRHLKDGSVTCCKACQEGRPQRDITGQRFGRLTALYPTQKRDRNQSVIWRCRCDCGNEVEHSCSDLQTQAYISCGCLKREAERKLKDQTTHVAGTTVELLQEKKVRCDSTTGITGVNPCRGKYKAVISFQGKKYNLGTYKTVEEAALVRKEAEESLFGQFLGLYGRWKERAGADPEWGMANPISITVRRSDTGGFRVTMLPAIG